MKKKSPFPDWGSLKWKNIAFPKLEVQKKHLYPERIKVFILTLIVS